MRCNLLAVDVKNLFLTVSYVLSFGTMSKSFVSFRKVAADCGQLRTSATFWRLTRGSTLDRGREFFFFVVKKQKKNVLSLSKKSS